MRLRSVLLGAALAASGCYTYKPMEIERASPGETLRVRLTQAQADLIPDIPLAEGRLLDGTLVARSGSSMMVETTVGVNDASRGMRALKQRISVPLSEVQEVSLKRLDRGKTTLLSVAAGAVVVAVIVLENQGGSGSNQVPPPGTVESRRAPLLGLRLPFGR
jgi:hypothetical protein